MTIPSDVARKTLIDVDRRLVSEGGLRDFARLAWPQVEPGRMLWNWHLDVAAEHLEAATAGEIRNLLICVPPGTMKTLLVSVMWPAWEWTHTPASKWIYATYAQGLSDKSARQHRDIVASPWYQARWGETCSIPREAVRQVRHFKNSANGFRLSTAVGAGVTGHHGNRLVFDAFGKEGGGALASWMLLSGNEDALDPIFTAIRDLVEHLHEFGSDLLRPITQAMVLMALGDAMMGAPLAAALGLPSTSARAVATALVERAKAAAGVN